MGPSCRPQKLRLCPGLLQPDSLFAQRLLFWEGICRSWQVFSPEVSSDGLTSRCWRSPCQKCHTPGGSYYSCHWDCSLARTCGFLSRSLPAGGKRRRLFTTLPGNCLSIDTAYARVNTMFISNLSIENRTHDCTADTYMNVIQNNLFKERVLTV